jgi:hypothetical protein
MMWRSAPRGMQMKKPANFVDLLLGRVRRKRLALFVAGTLLALTGGANAADAVPQQFVGEWCADAKTPQLQPSKYESDPKAVIYRRARKCNAHEPEETITIRSDRLLISDFANCKYLETTSVTRHGTHRLKFWCKSDYETWIFDAWFSVPGNNKIGIEYVSEEFK